MNSENISFKGYYQGFLSTGKSLHKYPEKKVKACFYSDNMAMKIFSKIINSKTKSDRFQVAFKNPKSLIFEADRTDIKKLIPTLVRITRGMANDLDDQVFWKMLNNKSIKKIRYEISPQDLIKIYYKDLTFKHYSLDIYERRTQEQEVKKTTQKIKEFKQNISKRLTTLEEESWLDRFFQDVKQPKC